MPPCARSVVKNTIWPPDASIHPWAGVMLEPPVELPVLYNDSKYVVVSKPAGLLVHPTPEAAGETESVVTLLAQQLDVDKARTSLASRAALATTPQQHSLTTCKQQRRQRPQHHSPNIVRSRMCMSRCRYGPFIDLIEALPVHLCSRVPVVLLLHYRSFGVDRTP
eukprot:SAG11_NODE_3198_length_2616_cov_1.517282_2_plen_165_part_00